VANDVAEGLRVSAVKAPVEVGRPGVVAGTGARVLRPVSADVISAILRRVAGAVVGALVPVGHALPVAQASVDLGEAWPTRRDLVPALHHEGVHPGGAFFRTWQQLPRVDHLYHLLQSRSFSWFFFVADGTDK
jgi:hypothetical protein